MIRNKDQEGEILKAGDVGEGTGGKVNVLVESLDDVKSVGDAERILKGVRPDWVVWSAGMLPFINFDLFGFWCLVWCFDFSFVFLLLVLLFDRLLL